jgi:hypothetical protein
MAEEHGPRMTEASSKRRIGQGLVEFALILPVMLLLIFVIIELARLLHAWLSVENAARFAIRYAVTSEYDGSHCLNGADAKGNCIVEDDIPVARILSIDDVAYSGAPGILRNPAAPDWSKNGYFKVTICALPDVPGNYTPSDQNNWSTDWTAQCTGGDNPGEEGQRIAVTVDFNHPLITPVLSGLWPQMHLTSRRDGIVETFRTVRYVGSGSFEAAAPIYSETPTPTPSDTPTPTETASPTPTPDCSLIYFTGMWQSRYDRVAASVANDNTMNAYLTTTHLEWPQMESYGAYVNWFEFRSNQYWGGNGGSSPTDLGGSWERLGGGDEETWEADFSGQPPEGIWGDFTVGLTFAFDDWPVTCNITRHIYLTAAPTSTPTYTRTPTRTPTYGPSPTRTATRTATRTRTPTRTPTYGPSPTRTNTQQPTNTRTPTKTATTGPSPTKTFTKTATEYVPPTATETWKPKD